MKTLQVARRPTDTPEEQRNTDCSIVRTEFWRRGAVMSSIRYLGLTQAPNERVLLWEADAPDDADTKATVALQMALDPIGDGTSPA